MHGTFIWNELATDDIEAAKRFYGELFGWTYEGMPMGGNGGTYWVAQAGGKHVAGLFDKRQIGLDHVPPHWLSYVAVDDVDARARAAEAKGGKTLRPAFDVPEVGRIAILSDPTGAAIAIMTPVPKGA